MPNLESLRITRQTNRLGNLLPLPEFLSPCRPVWIRRRWSESAGGGPGGLEGPPNEGEKTKVCLRSDSGNVARFYYAHMGHYLSQWSAWTSKNGGQFSYLQSLLTGWDFFVFWKECSVQQAFFTFTLSNPDFSLYYLEATSLLLLR